MRIQAGTENLRGGAHSALESSQQIQLGLGESTWSSLGSISEGPKEAGNTGYNMRKKKTRRVASSHRLAEFLERSSQSFEDQGFEDTHPCDSGSHMEMAAQAFAGLDHSSRSSARLVGD